MFNFYYNLEGFYKSLIKTSYCDTQLFYTCHHTHGFPAFSQFDTLDSAALSIIIS